MRNIWIRGAYILPVLILGACSEADKACPGEQDEIYEITRVTASMAGSMENNPAGATRATVSGFVVNTADDPSHQIADKLGWTLDLTLYDIDDVKFDEGSGTFTWNSTDSYWVSQIPLYMPNYLMQKVEAILYPSTWTPGASVIATDQEDIGDFVLQDVLVQNGDPVYRATPAHLLEVQMRHAHSMIDFVLAEVDPDDISTVTVTAGGKVYLPYKAAITSREEYLVILPLGIAKPVIEVTTNAGARYHKELDIASTAINTCYYVRLVGLELTLEAITVSNWAYGEAVAGDYSSVTSYPTFRGTPNSDLTIYYDNGKDQTISFNDRGEATVKPLGRTITRIEGDGLGYTFPQPLSIRTQVIDLNDYIALMV